MQTITDLNSHSDNAVAQHLSRLLADSYTLYLKTQNYHWNVTGPLFCSLHALFEEHYTDLAAAVDEIAERIRALGVPAPGSYSEFAELTRIEEASGNESATDMIQALLQGQETISATTKSALQVASDLGDEPSADLLTQRLQRHEKNAWMLRSMLVA